MQEERNESDIVNESDTFSFKDDNESSDVNIEHSTEEPEQPIEDEGEPESEPEHEKPKGKKPKNVQTRINELQRDKHRALQQAQDSMQQLEQLRHENERLKQYSETTNQAAMIHYDQSVKLREQNARKMLTQAIETGDVNLQVEATEELAGAKSEMKNLDAWRAQERMKQEPQHNPEEYYQQQHQQQYQQPRQQQYETETNPETQEWIDSNPWIHKDSPEFDPELAEEVINYAAALDRRFIRTGQQDKIMTKEYYDDINRYISGDAHKPQSTRTLNMKSSNIPVAGVSRSSNQAQSANQNTVVLTAEQKQFANLMKIPLETYAKHVLLDRREQAIKRSQQ